MQLQLFINSVLKSFPRGGALTAPTTAFHSLWVSRMLMSDFHENSPFFKFRKRFWGFGWRILPEAPIRGHEFMRENGG
ncbi:MAG: hypothetical protein A2139_04570 [Desulfobacca sp. RBG_16_60_12]|nr:MAG: hypothetical protein A2139_04570 [Desulfobacca sp. RBG_16_60_12]